MDTYGEVSKKLIPRRKASAPCSLAPGARAWPFDSELLGCLGYEQIVEDENEERKKERKKERDFNGQLMETGLECTGGLDWTGLDWILNSRQYGFC